MAKKQKAAKNRKSVARSRQKKLRLLLHRRTQIIVAAALLVIATIAIFAQTLTASNSQTGRLVTFHDRGENHVILTHADTVKAALSDAGISIEPQDVVEPSIDSKLLKTDSAVIIYRARPVLVVDGSLKQKVMTAAQSPNEIALAAGVASIGSEDKTTLRDASIVSDGASETLTIERSTPTAVAPIKKPTANALTAAKGAQIFVDSAGVAHRETYYDLPMNIVITACGPGDYTIRYDGAKIDAEGYVLVAANYGAYPRCSIVETSMGPGKVYDTGGFALRYPHGFDLATDWTNYNGR